MDQFDASQEVFAFPSSQQDFASEASASTNNYEEITDVEYGSPSKVAASLPLDSPRSKFRKSTELCVKYYTEINGRKESISSEKKSLSAALSKLETEEKNVNAYLNSFHNIQKVLEESINAAAQVKQCQVLVTNSASGVVGVDAVQFDILSSQTIANNLFSSGMMPSRNLPPPPTTSATRATGGGKGKDISMAPKKNKLSYNIAAAAAKRRASIFLDDPPDVANPAPKKPKK